MLPVPVFVALVFLLVLCFLVLVFFAVEVDVLLWSGVAGAGVDCAKVKGSVAAAKTIPSKLFFILILLVGFFFPTTLSSTIRSFCTIDSKGYPGT